MWQIPTLKITKLSESDNEMVKNTKSTFLLDNSDELDFIKFPGFKISERNLNLLNYAKLYKAEFENKVTPPRGNLSTSCEYAIVGIRPGQMHVNHPHEESCWLFGPCSKMMHDLIRHVGKMPYLTNVYKQWDDENLEKSISNLFTELDLVVSIVGHPITIVTLGTYDEYSLVDDYCRFRGRPYLNIWHPSYLCRSYSEEKFERWSNKVKYFYAF